MCILIKKKKKIVFLNSSEDNPNEFSSAEGIKKNIISLHFCTF